MQSIRNVERLNALELEKVVPPNASWHTDYRDTAYIYIGGLPFELSEGDILTIFSQYGNPVHINLARDKETGKSRGFAFLKYEDQRSCDLAVDNLSGASVLGRLVSVDHTRYKLKEGEKEEEVALALKAVGRRREKEKKHRHHRSRRDEMDEDGEGREKRRRHRSGREESEDEERDRRHRRSKHDGSEQDGYEDDRDRRRARRDRSPAASDEEVGVRDRGHRRR
ncbi:hypothetical protein EJ03DRAFT_320737 [Teratosphaeria nubilosa]|uniref:RRM domain-containing protein n=1 Tax=Teratosphaeria nubilosa TaxID=161662 RepID=A0A6G1KWS7_9PEZI|nr:hypothetical protein EJ03DRAFT_320737 [Teratosphaeria nubilosa]